MAMFCCFRASVKESGLLAISDSRICPQMSISKAQESSINTTGFNFSTPTKVCTLSSLAACETFQNDANDYDAIPEPSVNPILTGSDASTPPRLIETAGTATDAHQPKQVQQCSDIPMTCFLHNSGTHNSGSSSQQNILKLAERNAFPSSLSALRKEHISAYSVPPSVSEQLKVWDTSILTGLVTPDDLASWRSLTMDTSRTGGCCRGDGTPKANTHPARIPIDLQTTQCNGPRPMKIHTDADVSYATALSAIMGTGKIRNIIRSTHDVPAGLNNCFSSQQQVVQVGQLNSSLPLPFSIGSTQQQQQLQHARPHSLSGGFPTIAHSSCTSDCSSALRRQTSPSDECVGSVQGSIGSSRDDNIFTGPPPHYAFTRVHNSVAKHWSNDQALRRRRVEILAGKILLPSFTKTISTTTTNRMPLCRGEVGKSCTATRAYDKERQSESGVTRSSKSAMY